MTMKNSVLLASCGLLAVTLVACGGESGGSPTQSNSEGFQNGYNSFSNTLTDSRDGQVYRTVTIGEQTWMAENLNYAMDGSYCYDDDPANCAKYGRLYTWSVSKTACPTGWHLPTKDDWWTLFDLVNEAYPDSAKWALLAKGYDHWPKAFDAYGFSALPAGEGGFYGELTRNFGYKWLNHTAFFQISTSSCSVSCDLVCLDDDCAAVFLPNNSPTSALSIRCLKNDAFYQEPSQSSAKSSSSFERSSSSALLKESCKTEIEDNCEYGLLTDIRDGKTYKTVKIGNQVWMAENLNFEVENSVCYNNSVDSCSKYGRLYTWDVAKGVCPSGWHLPDTSEWRTLYSAMGNSPYAMQAKCVAEWPNATDAYCFSALPAGFMGALFSSVGSGASFWSVSPHNCYDWSECTYGDAYYYWSLDAGSAHLSYNDVHFGYAIRCLQD